MSRRRLGTGEVELVASATTRKLWLTGGIATATLLVVASVLAGPALVTCYASPDGFSSCLREQVVQIGLLPADETPPAVVAEPQPEPPQPEEVAPAAASPAEARTPALKPPALDLLRAEPDGSLVIAGSGAPSAEVEVYADGELLGATTAEASGDWVIVPDRPLPPGGAEITVGAAGSDLRSEQSFVVVIDEEKEAEPLIVATAPGEASRILQGLTPPPATPTLEEAAPEPAPAAEQALRPPLLAPPAPGTVSEPEAVVEPEAETAGEPEAAIPEAGPAPESAIRTALAPAPEASAAPDAAPTAPAPEAGPDVALADPQPVEEPEPAANTLPLVPPVIEPGPGPATEASEPQPVVPDLEIALATPEQPVPAATEEPASMVPPSIDAVEIDGNTNFFAGGGEEGATVRLYVDDRFIADTEIDGGRWLVEAEGVLTEPEQRVRVDMLEPGSAQVVARAEVNFVVELPEPETAAEAPAAPEPEDEPAPTPESVGIPDAAVTDEPDQQPLPAPEPLIATESDPEPQPGPAATPRVERLPEPTVAAAPEPEPESTPPPEIPAPEPAAEPEPVRERSATAEPAPGIEPEPLDSAPLPPPEEAALPTPPAEGPGAATPARATPAEPAEAAAAATPVEPVAPVTEEAVKSAAADDEVPVLTARQVGDPEENRFVSGTAIIRRGDNLWSIARRVYGHGVRYTTIYRANHEQIRNPDLIYPGQVFDLPSEADD